MYFTIHIFEIYLLEYHTCHKLPVKIYTKIIICWCTVPVEICAAVLFMWHCRFFSDCLPLSLALHHLPTTIKRAATTPIFAQQCIATKAAADDDDVGAAAANRCRVLVDCCCPDALSHCRRRAAATAEQPRCAERRNCRRRCAERRHCRRRRAAAKLPPPRCRLQAASAALPPPPRRCQAAASVALSTATANLIVPLRTVQASTKLVAPILLTPLLETQLPDYSSLK
jgi:hypothetical protein